jgi:hypothetical protein
MPICYVRIVGGVGFYKLKALEMRIFLIHTMHFQEEKYDQINGNNTMPSVGPGLPKVGQLI